MSASIDGRIRGQQIIKGRALLHEEKLELALLAIHDLELEVARLRAEMETPSDNARDALREIRDVQRQLDRLAR